MNKFLLLAVAVMLAAFTVNATAPAYDAVDAVYERQIDTTISSSTAKDTLAADDSVTILSKFKLDQRADYVLTRDAFTGTAADGSGTDSVSIRVRVDCLDGSNNLIYSVDIDTMSAAVGEAIHIPVGGSLMANNITMKWLTFGDDGSQVIINRVHLWKRSPITRTKVW